MDEKHYEMAEQVTSQELEEGIRRVKALLQQETHEGFDGVHCIECTEDIEPERLKHRFIRCFECQDRREKLKKRGLA